MKREFGAAMAVALVGCATTIGDISSIERLPSNVGAPSAPPEPTRPAEFPPVELLWARTAGLSGQPVVDDAAYTGLKTTPGIQATDRASPPGIEKSSNPRIAEFDSAASRAIGRVESHDFDDDAILLALKERLLNDPELEPRKKYWKEPIEAAIARAARLRRIRIVMANLRQAYANAKLNPDTSLYMGVDMVSCRRAFALLYEKFADEAELEVNIEPVGRKPLPSFNELCEFSHQAELATVVFPDNVGKQRLRKIARRAVKKSYSNKNAQLKQISVVEEAWRMAEDGSRRELLVTIGIIREDAFPEDPCVMQEVLLWQDKVKKKFKKKPQCCEIRSEHPILCELLE